MTEKNTLAYYEHSKITEVKRFMTLGPGATETSSSETSFQGVCRQLPTKENLKQGQIH
jgi:hypothetical protein